MIGNSRKKSGLVLIAVMWIMVILTIIVSVIAQASRIDTRTSLSTADRIRCKWACRAGLETAIAVLNDDKDYNFSDTFDDLWYDNPEDFNSFELTDCMYSAEVIDECGKLNVNTASKKQLLYLPLMTEEIANSIIDWRDENDDVLPGSAEAGYYINMPYPYEIRNESFRSMRELLLVKDVTKELFYGTGLTGSSQAGDTQNEGWVNYLSCYSYTLNRDSDDNQLININNYPERSLRRKLEIPESYAKWIVENRKKGFKKLSELITKNSPKTAKKDAAKSDNAQPLDIQTIFEIADKITLTNDKMVFGKVNINTAPVKVLYALLEGDETLAETIISQRMGTEGGFSSLADLANIASADNESLKKLLDNVTVRSDVFTVKVTATSYQTSAKNTIETVVDRYQSPARLLYYCTGVKN